MVWSNSTAYRTKFLTHWIKKCNCTRKSALQSIPPPELSFKNADRIVLWASMLTVRERWIFHVPLGKECWGKRWWWELEPRCLRIVHAMKMGYSMHLRCCKSMVAKDGGAHGRIWWLTVEIGARFGKYRLRVSRNVRARPKGGMCCIGHDETDIGEANIGERVTTNSRQNSCNWDVCSNHVL